MGCMHGAETLLKGGGSGSGGRGGDNLLASNNSRSSGQGGKKEKKKKKCLFIFTRICSYHFVYSLLELRGYGLKEGIHTRALYIW